VPPTQERGPQPELTGPRVRLRPWRDDDVDAVLEACQDAEIQRWTQVPVPYRREHAETFVTDLSDEAWSGGGALFAVEPVDGGPLAGSIGLFPPTDGVGEIGYWTVAGRRGNGFTAEAVRVLCGWALAERGLHRLELHVDPGNTASARVAERAGFRAEGLLRQRFLHRGQPADFVMYGLLRSDPRPAP
jgi:RimJ/RimL family protein N-acetyltransferase